MKDRRLSFHLIGVDILLAFTLPPFLDTRNPPWFACQMLSISRAVRCIKATPWWITVLIVCQSFTLKCQASQRFLLFLSLFFYHHYSLIERLDWCVHGKNSSYSNHLEPHLVCVSFCVKMHLGVCLSLKCYSALPLFVSQYIENRCAYSISWHTVWEKKLVRILSLGFTIKSAVLRIEVWIITTRIIMCLCTFIVDIFMSDFSHQIYKYQFIVICSCTYIMALLLRFWCLPQVNHWHCSSFMTTLPAEPHSLHINKKFDMYDSWLAFYF